MKFAKVFLLIIASALCGCVGYVSPMGTPSAGSVQIANPKGALGFSWNNPGVVVNNNISSTSTTYACDNGWRPQNINGQAACLDGNGVIHPARVVSQGVPPIGTFPYGSRVSCPQVPVGNGLARCQ